MNGFAFCELGGMVRAEEAFAPAPFLTCVYYMAGSLTADIYCWAVHPYCHPLFQGCSLLEWHGRYGVRFSTRLFDQRLSEVGGLRRVE